MFVCTFQLNIVFNLRKTVSLAVRSLLVKINKTIFNNKDSHCHQNFQTFSIWATLLGGPGFSIDFMDNMNINIL